VINDHVIICQKWRETGHWRLARAFRNGHKMISRFTFGQREDSIIQVAYTVPDIAESMRRYSELLHIGPWFLVGPFVPAKGIYRGTPTDMTISLGVAFAGQVMIELIEQHDDKPSVYQETLKLRGAHGFHHWAIGARDFDAAVAHYNAQGFPTVFSDISPRGVRVIYVDTSAVLPGMLEIIEMTPGAEAQYQTMFDAVQTWDGKSHVVHQLQARPAGG
jgi:hypothetical protein